ncbi:unnamed protein product [Mytilus edulis]|uniref:Uncharacterized protein n=1 Tax=Mytilus edulis TaxID=6550 RepID=A0A8S3TIR2_MYTED|nr:unnamed protein product [Mytilus edulis]
MVQRFGIIVHSEVQIGGNEFSVKFNFNPGQHEIGYYRLYARIEYHASMTDWLEESMFVKLEQPPPHAFTKGGASRTIGDYKKKWYETNFVRYIENHVAFISASILYTVIDSLQNSNSTCMKGSEFYVKAEIYKYLPTREQKDETTEAYDNRHQCPVHGTGAMLQIQ